MAAGSRFGSFGIVILVLCLSLTACASRRAYDEAMAPDALARPGYGTDRVITAMATASPEERQVLLARWRLLWPKWLQTVQADVDAAERRQDDTAIVHIVADSYVWAVTAHDADLPIDVGALKDIGNRSIARAAARHYQAAVDAEAHGRLQIAVESYRRTLLLDATFRDAGARYQRLARAVLPQAIVAWTLFPTANSWDKAEVRLQALMSDQFARIPIADVAMLPLSSLGPVAKEIFARMPAPRGEPERRQYETQVHKAVAERSKAPLILHTFLDDGHFETAADVYEGQIIRRDIQCRVTGKTCLVEAATGKVLFVVNGIGEATAHVRFRWDDRAERERSHPEAFEQARIDALKALVNSIYSNWEEAWDAHHHEMISRYVRQQSVKR